MIIIYTARYTLQVLYYYIVGSTYSIKMNNDNMQQNVCCFILELPSKIITVFIT